MKIRLFLLLIFNSYLLFGQKNDISFYSGYGFYDMSQLKAYQQFELAIMTDLVPAKILENFPANNYIGINWRFRVSDKYSMGFLYEYHTTGSQVNYADFSGELYNKILTSAYVFGLIVDRNLVEFKKIKLNLYSDWLFYSSAIKIKYNHVFGEILIHKTTEFDAINPGVETGLKTDYKINSFHVGCKVGYSFNANSKVYFKDNNYLSANIPDMGILRINWSGLRLNLLIGYEF